MARVPTLTDARCAELYLLSFSTRLHDSFSRLAQAYARTLDANPKD